MTDDRERDWIEIESLMTQLGQEIGYAETELLRAERETAAVGRRRISADNATKARLLQGQLSERLQALRQMMEGLG